MMLRILVLALLAGNAFSAGEPTTPVIASVVTSVATLPAVLDWSGRVNLTLPVAGVIERIEVQAGEVVKKGALLASLNPTLFRAGVAEARADLDRLTQEEADELVEKLHSVLPRQMFSFKIQGFAMGRILASRSMSAMQKDVTDYLYGGDITRKMKLREKQKKGK